MTRRISLAVVLAVVAVSGSCRKFSTEPGLVCTAVAIAGIYINVQDRLTDTPQPFTGLWARAVDGTFRDSSAMAFTNPQTGVVSIALVYERPGTYDVTVNANGYQQFVRTGVVVTKGECHVNPVEIVARLLKP